MSTIHNFFATAPKGMERLLAKELRPLGALDVSATRGGVSFKGTLETAYRACLWSRTANRILMPIARFRAPTPEKLYKRIREIAWDDHLLPQGTLAVDCFTSDSRITHSHYGALKVKDGIVDQFREAYGIRPSVDLKEPDLRINVYLYKDRATVSLDLSGESLHRRAYREEGLTAPLKENLAAAILLKAGWPHIAASDGSFLDPMCGSGTLPIEAAMMAADIAPGLLRSRFGFMTWRAFDASLWKGLLDEAKERRLKGLRRMNHISGYDRDPKAVKRARLNVARAGFENLIHIEIRDIAQAKPFSKNAKPGLVAVNPPYGKRLGEKNTLSGLYSRLEKTLKKNFKGWRIALFTGNPDLCKQFQLDPEKEYALYNGPIKCKLMTYRIHSQSSKGRMVDQPNT